MYDTVIQSLFRIRSPCVCLALKFLFDNGLAWRGMAWWTDCEWRGLTSVAVDSLFDALCRGYLDYVARVFGCDFVDFEWSGECAERRNTGCKAMCRNVTV